MKPKYKRTDFHWWLFPGYLVVGIWFAIGAACCGCRYEDHAGQEAAALDLKYGDHENS